MWMINREKLLSMLGAFIAIWVLSMTTQSHLFGQSIHIMVIASMGASAFLIFVTPHSPMAQPWPVIAGHILSAILGVACAQWIHDMALAAATAVALSILAMHLSKSLHPPSAATALIAVLGNEQIHALAWQFCYQVVMINCLLIALLGMIINRLLLNKRYPLLHTHHEHHQLQSQAGLESNPKLNEENFRWAIQQMDGIIDVTEEDLVDLYEFAIEHAMQKQVK